MEDIVRQRIKEVLAKNNSNINQLANDDAAFQNRLSRQLNQGAAISCDTILRFLKAYKEVSADWLLRGSGKMCFDENLPAISGEESEDELTLKIDVSKLVAEKEEMLIEIQTLKDELLKKIGCIEGLQDYISKLIIENNILSQKLGLTNKKDIV
jgi:Mg2+ and Co2+ transporter CorA